LWPAVGVVLLALGTAMLLPSVRPRQASLALAIHPSMDFEGIRHRLVFAEGADRLSPVEHWAIVLGLVPVLVLLCFTTFRLIKKPAMDAVPR